MPWEEVDENVGEVGTEGAAGGTKIGTSPILPYIWDDGRGCVRGGGGGGGGAWLYTGYDEKLWIFGLGVRGGLGPGVLVGP